MPGFQVNYFAVGVAARGPQARRGGILEAGHWPEARSGHGGGLRCVGSMTASLASKP